MTWNACSLPLFHFFTPSHPTSSHSLNVWHTLLPRGLCTCFSFSFCKISARYLHALLFAQMLSSQWGLPRPSHKIKPPSLTPRFTFQLYLFSIALIIFYILDNFSFVLLIIWFLSFEYKLLKGRDICLYNRVFVSERPLRYLCKSISSMLNSAMLSFPQFHSLENSNLKNLMIKQYTQIFFFFSKL